MQMKKTLLVLFYAVSFYVPVFSQKTDTSLINALIKDIVAAQITTDGEFYKGTFPSFRQCGGAPHNYQPDNNIFFTAIAAFALKNMLPGLSEKNKTTVRQIIKNAAAAYPYYKSQYGDPYYNFWPTHSTILPHSYYFKYLKSVFSQGEDADDSVMILMTSDNDDSATAILKQRMIEVANKSNGKKIISTYRKYRNIPAYSTYLGTRMTPDFDFAVHCNLLYFMYEKHLPITIQDSATLYLLTQMVKNREYMKAPVYLSPYYVKASILIYHVTRLMGAFNIPELNQYKEQIIADIHALLEKSNNVMDQIILRTSLLRLGASAPELDLQSIKEFEESNQQQYIFFQARAAFSYPTPFKQIFLHWSYITYYFYCPSYNKILWLEYLVEKEKRR
jgi:hypothetical protein